MEIFKFFKLNETKISFGDLLKSNPPKSVLMRGELLVQKLKNGGEFEVSTGKIIITGMLNIADKKYYSVNHPIIKPLSQITDDDGNFDPVKSKPFLNRNKVFQTANGSTYKLTDLHKTVDFGSKGAGRNTNENEIIQMLLLSVRLDLGRDFIISDVNNSLERFVTEKNPNDEGEPQFPENCNIPDGFKIRDLDLYTMDKNWMGTFLNCINNISKAESNGKNLFLNNKNYEFYHNSLKDTNSIHKVILSKFKECLNANKYGDILKKFIEFNQMDFSKYCPADIWVINQEKNEEIKTKVKSCQTIEELNDVLNSYFDIRDLIPVSLKKVGTDINSGIVITNNEIDSDLPIFNVVKFHLESDIENGIGVKIDTDSTWTPRGKSIPIKRERNLRIDTSDSSKFQNVDGEVDGKYARHGKASFLVMKKFIERSPYFKHIKKFVPDNPLQTSEELKYKNVDELKQILKDLDAEIKELSTGPIGIEISYDLKGMKNHFREKKLISKIQSLQIIRALTIIDLVDPSPRYIKGVANPNNQVDIIMGKILLYALSINNGGFSTPRYARVI
jgi:hypothetical protein